MSQEGRKLEEEEEGQEGCSGERGVQAGGGSQEVWQEAGLGGCGFGSGLLLWLPETGGCQDDQS